MPVACPLFEPLSKADSTDRPAPARSPLGAVFNGLCHASEPPLVPDTPLIWDSCNFGYGRDRCPHFPSATEADTVRFSEHKGRLLWILEKDYQPLRHGCDSDGSAGDIVACQAQAFRSACLGQKP